MNSEQQPIESPEISVKHNEEESERDIEMNDAGAPILSHSPSKSLSLIPILDVDLNWLGQLPIIDRVPALQGVLDIFKESPIKVALLTHLAYIDDVPSRLFPEIKDPNERRRRFTRNICQNEFITIERGDPRIN